MNKWDKEEEKQGKHTTKKCRERNCSLVEIARDANDMLVYHHSSLLVSYSFCYFISLLTLSSASINKVLQSDLIQWLHLLQPLFFLRFLHHDKFHRNRMHKSWFGDDKFKFVCFQSQNMPTCTFYDAQTPESKSFILCCLWFVPLTHTILLWLSFFKKLPFQFFTTTMYSDIQKHAYTHALHPSDFYTLFFSFRCV